MASIVTVSHGFYSVIDVQQYQFSFSFLSLSSPCLGGALPITLRISWSPVSIPDTLEKERRGLGNTTLLCTINKVYCTQFPAPHQKKLTQCFSLVSSLLMILWQRYIPLECVISGVSFKQPYPRYFKQRKITLRREFWILQNPWKVWRSRL